MGFTQNIVCHLTQLRLLFKGFYGMFSAIERNQASFPSKGAFPPSPSFPVSTFLSTFQVVNLDLFVPIGVKINHLLCKDFEYENVNHPPESHLRRRIGATVKAVKASCDPVSSFGKIVWRRKIVWRLRKTAAIAGKSWLVSGCIRL